MKLLRWLLLLILTVVVLVVGAVWYLLFTQPGRDVLVAKVNDYTSTLATPVMLGRLEGHVLSDVRLSSVTVADAGGVWLAVDGIRLVWQPWALWEGTAPFELLDVAKIVVSRMPVVAETVEKAPSKATSNPLDYLIYVPRNLRLEDVTVEAAVAGKRQRLRAEIASAGAVQDISISTLEGPATEVSGSVVVDALDAGRLDLVVREAAQGLLGGMLKLPAKAEINAQVAGGMRADVFTLENLEARLGQTHMTGQGEGVLDGSRVSATVVLAVPDMTEWKAWLGEDVRGAVYGTAGVSGSLADLGFNVDVSRTDITASDVRVAGGRAVVAGRVNVVDEASPFAVAGDVAGRLSGVGQGVYPLTISLDVSGTQAALGGTVSASMVRKGERAAIVVTGAGVVSPLTATGKVAGSWVQGKNAFKLAGGVDVTPARARLSGLRLDGPGTVVSGSGVVDLVTKMVDGSAVVRVADMRPLAALAGFTVTGGMDADVVASGRTGVQTGNVNVRRFEVTYGDYIAKLKQASRLAWDGKQGSLTPFELEIAGGSVVAQGRMNADSVNGELAVKNIDIEQLADSDTVTGRLNLTAKVSGRSSAPVIVVSGDLVGKTGTYPLDVKLTGDWRGARLAVVGDVKSDAATARAEVTVGGSLSLMPFALGINEASSLRGTVAADVPLAMFNPMLWASRQQVGGRLSGQATLAGSLKAPDVGGKFVLADGSYTHSTSGVCLKNVGADIMGSRDRVVVENLRSADGVGGSLSGSASVGLQGIRALSAKIDLDNLQLFCGGLATGKIAGNLGAQGTLGDHTLSGKLVIGPLNVQLPGNSNETDIPQVETIRVKPGALENAAPLTITRLAIDVDAPQKVYVRGRGLDAEFGGNIAVGGTADKPLLTGSLKALRGQFTLLDRTLQLADTSVRFEGPIPPSPYLDVKATTTAQGTQITLNVTGTAAKPSLSLSSDPSLPQDEVLALLLFGRKLENISAFEALKLAQATRVLAGLDGGEPGILDKARQTLGVDTLDIGSGDESGDVTVTTGKYLTDNIYLSIEQGAEPEDREIKTEIELTPSVTGNTTVDGVGNQSFGVEWKRNY